LRFKYNFIDYDIHKLTSLHISWCWDETLLYISHPSLIHISFEKGQNIWKQHQTLKPQGRKFEAI
jgi:hypothetical protein